MTVQHDEEWVQIATLDEQDHIYFTAQYLEILGSLGWEAKAFAAHLLGLWYDPFEHVLDYISGYAKYTNDNHPATLEIMAWKHLKKLWSIGPRHGVKTPKSMSLPIVQAWECR